MSASRWLGLATLTVLFATSSLAQEATPVGRWTTIDDETKKPKSVIAIYEENGKLFGKIEKLFLEPNEKPDPVCEKCEGALKNKPIIGMVIMRDLKKDDDEWTGGSILDPKNGKTYKCKIAVEDKGKKLKVRGYIGTPMLGRTQHWVRAEEQQPAQTQQQ
ncbi:DUF2147 domain-containing protein [Pyxidicoccus fallax]|uniref:DUF2147 domain-containing protein n=1 Tax=Pyxidicoccus fallax TaxID=394095 RepID=A0A848LGC5_9BACT|nr:DUF2147 domain-containing protein [Pyxidicoccus fallax]NMO14938.1 DUF2147 domain-containing protein [Pyxidicoccus fallax]NPC77514.1 DUF2147 domain-containing protein [Pyxidicoccus fallax]